MRYEDVERILRLKARRFYWQYGPDFCARHGVQMEDLEQACFLAYYDALRAFDPGKAFTFNTYLSHSADNCFKAAMGMQSTRRNPLNDATSSSLPTDESGGELGELLPDAGAEQALFSVDENDERSRTCALLEESLQTLPAIEEKVLRCRFYKNLTRAETAHVLGVTPSQVRTLEARGLQALRQDSRLHELCQ